MGDWLNRSKGTRLVTSRLPNSMVGRGVSSAGETRPAEYLLRVDGCWGGRESGRSIDTLA